MNKSSCFKSKKWRFKWVWSVFKWVWSGLNRTNISSRNCEVCMHLSVFYIHCTCLCGSVWRPEVGIGIYFSITPLPYFETGSQWVWKLADSARLSASEPQIHLSLIHSEEVIDMLWDWGSELRYSCLGPLTLIVAGQILSAESGDSSLHVKLCGVGTVEP